MNPQLQNNQDPEQLEHSQLSGSIKQAKPAGEIDKNFQMALKHRLLGHTTHHAQHHSFWQAVGNFFTNKFTIGLASGLLIAVTATSLNLYHPNDTKSPVSQFLSADYKVASLPSQSFGSLSNVQLVNKINETDSAAGGSNAAVTSPRVETNQINPDSTKIIAPESYPIYQAYTFKYTGGDLPQLDAIQAVYKRQKNNTQQGVAEFLRSLRSGVFNVSRLHNPNLGNITFSEDRDFGYTVNIDFENGSVNIFQNYAKWPQNYPVCTGEVCTNTNQNLTIDQVPADDQLIALANQFISDYEIPVSNYAKPFVDDAFRVQYQKASDKSSVYIPEIINVVYPLLIDNKIVYDESGHPQGIMISIDLRHNKVAGAYGLTTQQYQMSAYDGETNQDRLIKLAEQGGFRGYNYFPYDPAQKNNLTVELDTPQIVITSVWNYDQQTGNGSELYVPALMFPIIQNDQLPEYFYQKAVIIPLVKDILDNAQNQPQPIPLDDGPFPIEPAAPLPSAVQPQSAVRLPDTAGQNIKVQ